MRVDKITRITFHNFQSYCKNLNSSFLIFLKLINKNQAFQYRKFTSRIIKQNLVTKQIIPDSFENTEYVLTSSK